jgi:hypothetical protein
MPCHVTVAQWIKLKDASCSADGGDYPQGLPGSEINSDYAVDSHGLPCNEA